MSIISKVPIEIKEEAIKEGQEILEQYSESKPKNKKGKFLRGIAKIGEKLLPLLKYVKLNKK